MFWWGFRHSYSLIPDFSIKRSFKKVFWRFTRPLSHDRAFNNQVTGIIVPLDKIAPVSSRRAGHTVQSTTELAFTSQWNMSLFISSPFGCQWIQSGGVWLHILRVTSIQIWMKWLSSFVRCAFSNPLGSLCSMKSWKKFKKKWNKSCADPEGIQLNSENVFFFIYFSK